MKMEIDPLEGCSNLSNVSPNAQVKTELKAEDEDDDTFNTMALLELAQCVQANHEPLDYNPIDALINPKTNMMVCLYCLDEFEPQLLSEHLSTVHNYRRVCYKCNYCGSIFQEKRLLYIHRAQCKPPPKRSKRKTFAQIMREVEDKYSEDQNQFETVTCPICVLEMAKFCLKDHLLSVHKKVELSSECPHCGKTFKSKLTLKEHVKLVHEAIEDSVECELCGQKFRSLKYLSNHKRNVHPKGHQIHKCHVCGKEFKSRLCLHQHTKYVHPPAEASAACPHCENKVFKTKIGLQQHLKVSHGMKKMNNTF